MRDHFERILGLGNATDNDNDLVAYGYDGSGLSGKARLVLFPSQDEQLRLILTYCNRSNIDIVIRGNGANMVGMTVPNNSIVVTTQGFDRIQSLNAREHWVKVDCGVTLAQLNEALAPQGFRYPLEPSSKALTTVGAFLATNGSSRHSQLYGSALDTVVELDVMDGTGKFFTVTKDFADYIGNEGSVFILIRAKLKIVPLTPRSVDAHYFDSLHEAWQFIESIKMEKPLAIEFLDAAAATYAGINTRHTVLVEWESERGAQKFENHAYLMQKRDNARKALGQKGYIHIEDSSVDPDHFVEAIEWCRNKELPVVAHAGLGIIHPFFSTEQEKLRDEWYAWLTERGQSPSGQFGYGLRKKQYVSAELKQKIRRLKERYDYTNIVGRGKLYDFI